MSQFVIAATLLVSTFICLTMTARAAKYVLFHRHGQRAPTRNIASPIAAAAAPPSATGAQDDEDTWLGQLPSVAVFDRLNANFKIAQHPDNPTPVQGPEQYTEVESVCSRACSAITSLLLNERLSIPCLTRHQHQTPACFDPQHHHR